MQESLELKKSLEWSETLRLTLQNRQDLKDQLTQDIKTQLSYKTIDLWFEQAGISFLNNELPDYDECQIILRQLRWRVFSTLMVRDINQLASLEEVTQIMSYFADLSVMLAYRCVMNRLSQSHGIPISKTTAKPLELIIIAMGKLGGKELNVSSDIDLIMLYPEDGETNGRRPLSHQEFYIRVTQRMMSFLSEKTPFGFVFRTDLRLRPDGEGSPLVWSIKALRQYFTQQGREWERYAWIKARAIPARFFENSETTPYLNIITHLQNSFIYRKYIDFDVLASLRHLRHQIRQDWQKKADQRDDIEAHNNIKLGEGGIREIEFVVQLQQLIRGGSMPLLRTANLLATLQSITDAELISQEDSDALKNAYVFFRRLEHFLQYRNDKQTHLIPTDQNIFELLATTFGLSAKSFENELTAHRQKVITIFKNIFRIFGLKEKNLINEQNINIIIEEKENNFSLTDSPFSDEEQETLEKNINHFLSQYRIKALPEHSKQRVKDLIPNILDLASKKNNSYLVAMRLLTLIESIAQRSSYLALFTEYPDTLKRVANYIGISDWVAKYIIHNPLVLDSLINWDSLIDPIDIKETVQQLSEELDACILSNGKPDVEHQMNLMRDLQKRITFQLLVQDLEGIISVESLGDQLSELADVLLEESILRIWPLIQTKHLQLTDKPHFAVIAYGRLGGKELGYASDLDLVFLFDDPSDQAGEIYARLGRRLSNWLSSLTSSGRLYEIDMRLRPDGDSGLLAVSIDSFEKYQYNNAWVWEHQALTRARFAAGDSALGEKFESIRKKVLLQQRDIAQLKAAIIEMRNKMRRGHPNTTDLFDIKHDRGGMVDIEFITQYLILAHAHKYDFLLENLGNITLIKMAAKFRLIPIELALEAANAYRKLRKKQHEIRLSGQDKARISAHLMAEEKKAVVQLWNYVFDSNY